jgi:cytidine deaminase
MHGADVLIAVADPDDPTAVQWVRLRDALPHYWMTAFPDELTGWDTAPST